MFPNKSRVKLVSLFASGLASGAGRTLGSLRLRKLLFNPVNENTVPVAYEQLNILICFYC